MLLDGSVANVTYNFTYDFAGYAAQDQAYTYYLDDNYVYDARRCYLVTMYDEATAGTLNPIQKMTLGVALAEGESFMLDTAIMYYPLLDANIDGFKINGKFVKDNATFTAETAGVYTFDFFFEGDVEETEAPTEAPTEEATEAPTEEDTTVSTDTPTETTIEAPTEAPAVTDDNAVTTEAPTAAPAGGCGSVMTLAILPCLAAGFVLTSKKKED